MRRSLLFPLAFLPLVSTPANAADECAYWRHQLAAYKDCAASNVCDDVPEVKQKVAEFCGTTNAEAPAKRKTASNSGRSNKHLATSAEKPRKSKPSQEPPDEADLPKSCAYFTRPAVEDGARLNYHSPGAMVCYGGTMYSCVEIEGSKRWVAKAKCSAYSGWESLRAEKLEHSSTNTHIFTDEGGKQNSDEGGPDINEEGN